MKIKVIKDAYYNLEFIKGSEGRIIDYEGDKVPSWGVKIKEKKTENKTPKTNEAQKGNDDKQNDGNKAPEVKTPDEQNSPDDEQKKDNDVLNEIEKQQYLDLLINEAMDNDIVIEDADKKSIDEQIAELETKLGKGK